MPIVFTLGDDAIPIALMGLNEGVNVFVDGEGTITEKNLYIPAYIRRYPYMLARLRPDAQELSLCFDPTRSEEHTSELQSLMRISYAVFCLKKKNHTKIKQNKA